MLNLELYHYLALFLVMGNFAFLGLGGFVHWWYYHKNRDQADVWKMQPKKFLSKARAKEAALLGTFNMNLGIIFMAILTWGALEKGWTQLYYDINDYSYGWAALSVFLAFLFIEASAYYIHAYSHHNEFLYKKIHYIHHRYSAPTYFTISAMHPVEWIAHASYIILPAFLFPMHIGLYLFVMLTTFFYGFWDHSGIKLNINLPFHGTNQFHDDHHKYFHVNFGFLTPCFDRIHDTVRREGHHYNENTFNQGKGKVAPEKLGDNAIGKWVDYSTSFNKNN